MAETVRCPECNDVLRNGFDALIHAFEHGAEHQTTVSPVAQALADNVAAQGVIDRPAV